MQNLFNMDTGECSKYSPIVQTVFFYCSKKTKQKVFLWMMKANFPPDYRVCINFFPQIIHDRGFYVEVTALEENYIMPTKVCPKQSLLLVY